MRALPAELAVSEARSASEGAIVGMSQVWVQLRWFKSLPPFSPCHCFLRVAYIDW